MIGMVRVRPVHDADLPIFYAHQLDPVATAMAAFTSAEPADHAAFMTRWRRLLDDDAIVKRTVLVGDDVAGHVIRFERDGQPEVTYWIGRAYWGRGVATAALTALLGEIRERPIFARAAADNRASVRVLEKCGFRVCGHDRGFAAGRGQAVDEVILCLASDAAT
ncbi:MAG: GNAT family N-acetyltransferase [Phycisphaerales bacterium]|nr:GNAT family N-acetyltransferase [Phycisphaerae bacterium]NNF43884.1 GNAT family N-acetyltransferase [Phycisphaerales bacterium]NNM27023.1 GNAT family N-acetyltransferase [Phycisphaerales bacterium]